MKLVEWMCLLSAASLAFACAGSPRVEWEEGMEKNFENDVAFLERHVEVVLLSDSRGEGQVAVVPDWQGRVATSTNGGGRGASFGWINYELVESGEVLPHINVYGGEDRFWLGPEGGQFALFFEEGDPFNLEHWQTPALIDTEPFEVVDLEADGEGNRFRVSFGKHASLVNYSGTRFDFQIDRSVRLLDRSEAQEILGTQIPRSVPLVGFESNNRLTNSGSEPWTREGGMLSIWILGMYVPSPSTAVVLPYRPGGEKDLGPVVIDDYFGKVPSDRLQIGEDAIFFRADGQYRSKIGVPPGRARAVLGSWDDGNEVLTLVRFNPPAGATDYVNSKWEIQDRPFAGDAVNSYNDGPPEPGAKPLGPFYELETSSPAAALSPGESILHIHQTFHLSGPREELERISQEALGVSLDEIPF